MKFSLAVEMFDPGFFAVGFKVFSELGTGFVLASSRQTRPVSVLRQPAKLSVKEKTISYDRWNNIPH